MDGFCFFCEGGLPSVLTFGLLIIRPHPRPLLSQTFYDSLLPRIYTVEFFSYFSSAASSQFHYVLASHTNCKDFISSQLLYFTTQQSFSSVSPLQYFLIFLQYRPSKKL